MNMENPVTRLGHTFIVASKHKLITLIYASSEINNDGSIRSLKHDKVDSYADFDDLNFILGLDSSKPFSKQSNGDLKPIWVFTRDGLYGPQFPTTRRGLIKFLKENNKDFIVVVCNAVGVSAYHFTE